MLFINEEEKERKAKAIEFQSTHPEMLKGIQPDRIVNVQWISKVVECPLLDYAKRPEELILITDAFDNELPIVHIPQNPKP